MSSDCGVITETTAETFGKYFHQKVYNLVLDVCYTPRKRKLSTLCKMSQVRCPSRSNLSIFLRRLN